MSGVSVAVDVALEVLGSIRLLVNVAVPLPVGKPLAVFVVLPSAVATPVPKPDTPVDIGNPVALVSVPLLGVPKAPLNVTKAPADPTLTAKAVATPVPRPDTPVLMGSPVALVKVPLLGVPKAPLNVTKAPAEPTLTPRAVTTPVPVAVVVGATPAPPPKTIALAAKAADEASVPAAE